MTFTFGRRVGSNARNCSSALDRTLIKKGAQVRLSYAFNLESNSIVTAEEKVTLASIIHTTRPFASGGSKESL